MIEAEDIVTVVDDNGEEMNFVFVGVIKFDDLSFAGLVPLTEFENDPMPIELYRYEQTSESERFFPIDDPAIFDHVMEKFNTEFEKLRQEARDEVDGT